MGNVDQLEVDIDTRILWILRQIFDKDDIFDLDFVCAIVRAAYGQGYMDALIEPHGKLPLDTGFRVPERVDESD